MNLNYINKKLAMNYLDNDKALFETILRSFKQHYENLNLLKLDDKKFFEEIHHLKSLSKNIGAKELFELSNDMHFNKSRKTQNQLHLVLQNTLKEISKLEFDATNKNICTSVQSKEEIIQEILEAARKNRPKRVENAILKLENISDLSNNDLNLIKILNKELNQYNFKEIVNTLS